MGWKPGEGLGKNQTGSLEPISLNIKLDKRGNTIYYFLFIRNND